MSWNLDGLYYALTIVVVIGIIMMGVELFHVADGTWAFISGVVCTELEIDEARKVMLMRIFSTIIGVILGTLILLLVGPYYFSLFVSAALTTLLCQSIPLLKKGWKLATATSVIVLIAALQQHSVDIAEIIALERAAEVLFGSLVAGIISYLFSTIRPIKKNKINAHKT